MQRIFYLLFLPFFLLADVEPVVLLGGGIGSLTSAIYLGRAGFSPLVIEGKMPGGLLTQSHSVQNWPGEVEIPGHELTEKIRHQASVNNARFINGEVIAVDFSKRPFTITVRALDGTNQTSEIRAHSAIVAMGTEPNFLGIPGEKEFWGKGVTNCAVCDGALYKNKVVGVVGGGDAAILEALYLSNIAKQVYVFVRKDSLRAIEEARVALLRETPNVQFLYQTQVTAIQGTGDTVTGVTLKTAQGSKTFPLDGLFLAIGSQPNSKIFRKSLKLDSKGYLVLMKDQQTSVRGVYAVGDIVDPIYKQAITAAGDGAKAALQAQQYLEGIPKPTAPLKAAPVVPAAPVATKVIEIKTLDQFQQEVTHLDLPLLIDFYATWCPPCKRVAPVLDQAATRLAGKYRILKVNVDHHPGLVAEYHIQAMPTLILFNTQGEEVERQMGFEPIVDLLQRL